MKPQTLAVVALFGFIICAHSLFPPRCYEGSVGNRFRRGFILSDSFYTRCFSESGVELHGGNRVGRHSQVSYNVDWNLYCLELAALVGGALFVAALAQLIEFKIQKKPLIKFVLHPGTPVC